MRRREFVATGAALAAGASGCLDGEGDDWRDGEVTVDSRFADEDCPGLQDGMTRCYHEVGTEPDVHLVPEPEVGDPRQESIDMTLYNESDEPITSSIRGTNWRLYKRIQGKWRSMTPFRTFEQAEIDLEAGESHTWSLEMSNEVSQFDRTNPTDDDMAYTGPGTYYFGTEFRTGTRARIEPAALLEFEGEPVRLEPVGVAEHELNDGKVEVQTDAVPSHGDEEEGHAVVSAERVEEGDTEPVLTEIAAQLHPVRNTVYFFDEYDSDTVRFEGGRGLVDEIDAFHRAGELYMALQDEAIVEITEDGPDDDFPYRFRFLYDGTGYELTVEEYED